MKMKNLMRALSDVWSIRSVRIAFDLALVLFLALAAGFRDVVWLIWLLASVFFIFHVLPLLSKQKEKEDDEQDDA